MSLRPALRYKPYAYGWISKDELLESARAYGKSPYGDHLKAVADGKVRY